MVWGYGGLPSPLDAELCERLDPTTLPPDKNRGKTVRERIWKLWGPGDGCSGVGWEHWGGEDRAWVA